MKVDPKVCDNFDKTNCEAIMVHTLKFLSISIQIALNFKISIQNGNQFSISALHHL